MSEVRLARPADFEVFVAELTEAVAGVVAKHHDGSAGGRTFRLIAGAYPSPASSAEGGSGEP